MQTETRLMIRAPGDLVFALAADVARWPDLLPHYRSVSVLEEFGPVRTVRMHCVRTGFPCVWTARQTLDPAARRIHFEHLRGITTGMMVWWLIDETAGGSDVRIVHDLRLPWRWPLGAIGEWVIARVFVDHVAGTTLHRIRDLAQAGARQYRREAIA